MNKQQINQHAKRFASYWRCLEGLDFKIDEEFKRWSRRKAFSDQDRAAILVIAKNIFISGW